MDIDLPSGSNSSTEDSIFGGRIDLYEAYWLYVDGVRFVGPVLEQSSATADDTDRSPLARHYNHFYEKKEKHKEKCADLPGTLPKYKDYFEEPRGNVRKVPRKTLEELGIKWKETDDPIWLPPEYELPEVWEEDLTTLDTAELRDLVRELRAENEKLRGERDELKNKLAKVGNSLSNFLDSRGKSKSQKTGDEDKPTHICGKCGASFDSKAAKNGHSAHCDRSNSTPKELEDLANELPELNDQQAEEGHGNASAEEELENLNHLLKGSL
ncbi:hypothetical protein [Halorubrum cibi]|uniref:Uncharacterized protein n=1 Tax=Halorubrum cibi TaxID=413815 RepID=A0A521BVP2_9EURY|nr:hypothetical protein [Halorubrum cibi]SMO51267.1 hypothetical protein SAMN06264867_10395 [Halorubrum cibi]